MKSAWRWLGVGAAAALCVAFAAIQSRKSAVSHTTANDLRSALKVAPETVDFGEVSLGQSRSRVIMVHNTSAKPVSIYRVVPGCNCLSGTMSRETIPPAEKADLTLTFTGLPGKRSYQTTALLISDESGPSRYEVRVAGKVTQEFVIEPETLRFGTLAKGQSKTLEAIVRRVDGHSFRLKDVACPAPAVRLAFKPVDGPGLRAYHVFATVEAARAGPGTAEVTAVTDGAPETHPVLTLAYEIKSDYTCSPEIATSKIWQGKLHPFEVVVRTVVPGREVKIRDVRDGKQSMLKHTVEPWTEGAVKLKIDLVGWDRDALVGQFLIRVGEEDELLHLPYRIEMEPPSAGKSP